jgi:putative secretion ATPase (PEP-CTERM system associated)
MYEHYFKLTQRPFDLTPDPQFLFFSSAHRKALTYLDYGLKERIGFMLLTGEVGSGKTTLIRHCIRGLDSGVTLSKVSNTRVTAEQLLSLINEDFGIEHASRDKVRLVGDLNDFLIGEYRDGRRALLVIDEAQNLTPELLEEVRLLSNLETDDTKLLQILLVGQPELGKILELTEMRQLRQRISIACHLTPLNRQETELYLLHRLEVAGNRQAVLFSREALDTIHDYTGGIPRLLNVMGNFLLLTAFTEETREISRDMVEEISEVVKPPKAGPVAKPGVLLQGKRALLAALGAALTPDEGQAATRTESGQLPDDGGLKVLMNDLRLRMDAIEKEQGMRWGAELIEIRKRLGYLEYGQRTLHKEIMDLLERLSMHKDPPEGPEPGTRQMTPQDRKEAGERV